MLRNIILEDTFLPFHNIPPEKIEKNSILEFKESISFETISTQMECFRRYIYK